MRFWIEWALQVHRAVWFPLNWSLGLERPGIEMPAEFAPAIASGIMPPALTVIAGGKGSCSAGCTSCKQHSSRGSNARRRAKR